MLRIAVLRRRGALLRVLRVLLLWRIAPALELHRRVLGAVKLRIVELLIHLLGGVEPHPRLPSLPVREQNRLSPDRTLCLPLP